MAAYREERELIVVRAELAQKHEEQPAGGQVVVFATVPRPDRSANIPAEGPRLVANGQDRLRE